ncbi:LysR family transcriptional regulator [uncultured Subdoligranulum sp.]|uniref:LysR family transcriptional regulator n=1 Tax=uncultured Subdoligranulum sp. TaxID=512298 RepID=UPI003458F669
MMYNPQLETFLCVADAGSFNKAAATLYITPTAVVRQVNLLESSLGLTLFTRTHRGLVLTEAGKSLYKDSKYIIRYCKASVLRAKSAGGKERVIRIGTSPMTPGRFLVDLWPKVHSLCPDIKFELVPYENTPENAREILANLGQNIDIVAGPFDARALQNWRCAALLLSRQPIRLALLLHHPLAGKTRLTAQDLHGERLMMIRRGWNGAMDALRDGLAQKHPEIEIVDFDFFSLDTFNRCENANDLMVAIDNWKSVHPLLKVVPVRWKFTIPFGILHSPSPSPTVERFLEAIRQVRRRRGTARGPMTRRAGPSPLTAERFYVIIQNCTAATAAERKRVSI